MKNNFLDKIRNLSDMGIFEALFFAIYLICSVIVLNNDFSQTKVNIENSVMTNYCNYLIENDYFNVEKISKEKYSDDQDMQMYYVDITTSKDLCIDMYFRYMESVLNEN